MPLYVYSVVPPTNGVAITAGADGLEVVGFELFTQATSGATEFALSRVTSVSGGGSGTLTPMRDGDPAAVATTTYNPSSYSGQVALGQWGVSAAAPYLPYRYADGEAPWIASGHSFLLGSGFSGTVNIYLRE